jgi:serine/threonine protein kinase
MRPVTATISGNHRIEIPVTFGSYEFVRIIAHGTYSVIALVRDLVTRLPAACKIVSRDLLVEESLLEFFERELRIHESITHPNIVQFIDVIYHSKLIFIIMEYCDNGDLLHMIDPRNGMPEMRVQCITYDVLCALHYLHERNIVHRDLKPENILVNDEGDVKLADFGLSNHMIRNGLLDTPCGSLGYIAPEVLLGMEYDGRQSDIWSFGVILYAMCSGILPWRSRNEAEIRAQVVHRDFARPPNVSNEAWAMIERMMRANPGDRPTAGELLEDPWLAGVARQRKHRRVSGLKKSASVDSGRLSGISAPPVRRRLIVRPQMISSTSFERMAYRKSRP